MITITTNLDKTFLNISEQLRSAISPDTLLRHVAVNMLPVVRDRIHVEGLDAENTQIGTYSPGYMKVRTGIFTTNEKFKKGKNKGATKPTGVFTKGKKKGHPRPQYNRTNDTKVIASLTSEMENDFSVIAEGDKYGLGFKAENNFKKSQYVEATYNKKIWTLTPIEKDKVVELATEIINEHLK